MLHRLVSLIGRMLGAAMIGCVPSIAFFSPLLPPSCRHMPTCSVCHRGRAHAWANSRIPLTTWRLLRCHPWVDGV